MSYPISDVTRRVVYSGSAGVGPYSFTFEILSQTDIAVYKDDALLTLTTDYTVTINTNGTGSITLVVAATVANNITIIGNRGIQRTTDFVTGGDLFANSLNQELDSLTIFAQQVDEKAERGLKAPQTDPLTVNMTLPGASVRANKTLAFDNNGDPVTGEVIGDNRGDWAAGVAYNKRDIVKDTSNGNIYYANTSHTSSGSLPISTNTDSAKWDLIVDNASATASASAAATSASAAASSASAASTSASNASTSASNAASSASTATTQAGISTTQAGIATTQAGNAASSAASAAASAALAANRVPLTSSTGSAVMPTGTTAQRDGSPLSGYMRFNSTLSKFEGYNGSIWTSVGGGATGGGSDEVFVENSQTVTTDYTITTNKNAMSAGPITISSGITVTVPSGSNWAIV